MGKFCGLRHFFVHGYVWLPWQQEKIWKNLDLSFKLIFNLIIYFERLIKNNGIRKFIPRKRVAAD